MATTVYTGSVYGVAIYGSNIYGQYGVTYSPDGIAASATANPNVIITGDAVHVLISLVTPALVSSVGIIGDALFSVVGVSSTFALDTVDVAASAVVVSSGLEMTSAVDQLTISTTSFNYVADNYNRALTVYVESRANNKDRTILVAETWS